MDELTIPIPDGLSEAQKSDLTAWLTSLAQQIFDEMDQNCSMHEAIRRVSDRHSLIPFT